MSALKDKLRMCYESCCFPHMHSLKMKQTKKYIFRQTWSQQHLSNTEVILFILISSLPYVRAVIFILDFYLQEVLKTMKQPQAMTLYMKVKVHKRLFMKIIQLVS